MATTATTGKRSDRLQLLPLTGIVIGSMIGAGVFALPQNMATAASPGATLIGWIITGIGMLALAFVYQDLATRRPELDSGPYAYAKAGFGDFVGFNSAWGYWLSAWLGNVSYAVLIFSALGYFFPAFGEGNTWQAVLGASIALWCIHALVLRGVRDAAIVNVVTTAAKVLPLLAFALLILLAFRIDHFSLDFWGTARTGIGSVFDQVRNTMLVTLWVFIGIEGASVVSARAENRSDIGRATVLGFLATLVLYLLISMLAYGVMDQGEIAQLQNPSTAGVLEHVVGPWGAVLMNIGLVISVAGAFLSWTVLAAEIPFIASNDHTMPRFFGGENGRGSPATSLWITNILVQAFLIVTLFAQSTYEALFYTASTAILVPYVFSGAYALKLALTGTHDPDDRTRGRRISGGLIATVYGVWLVYAAGPAYLLMCALLYAPGIVFYMKARSENRKRMFTPLEAALAAGLVVAAVVAAILMIQGVISPL